MEYVQPIREKTQIEDMKDYIKANKDYKYYVMFMLGIYSALRIGDILQLKVRDVRKNNKIVDVVQLKTDKTNKIALFPINKQIKRMLKDYCETKEDYEYLIQNNNTHKPISRVQAYRVIRECAESVGMSHIGTHSLRKTFGYHYYTKTKDIGTLQEILGHSNQSTTMRYIGVTQETVLEAMKKFEYQNVMKHISDVLH